MFICYQGSHGSSTSRVKRIKVGGPPAIATSSSVMPLSEEQTRLLKTNETAISFKCENPKKPGSKAWERYEKYKAAETVGSAVALGAQWQDLSADFDKEFLRFKDAEMPAAAKRAAPEGTPDREAQNRSKHKPFGGGHSWTVGNDDATTSPDPHGKFPGGDECRNHANTSNHDARGAA